MIKKIRIFIFVGFCLSFLTSQARADDDFELDGINLDDIRNYEIENVALRLPGQAELEMLAKNLGEIVKEPLWQNTKAPKGRDILYLLPHKITAIEYGGVALNLFFNMTDKLHVSADSLLDLGNAINQKTLIDTIITILEGKDIQVSVEEITSLLPLFKKFTIQERKGGGFLQWGFVRGPFSIQMHTSLQFSERNFFLNKNDEEAIRAISNQIVPGGEFDEREFYRLAYGMGDTRLKVGMNTLNLTNFQTDVGVEAIFPTSRFTSRQPHFTIPEQGNALQLFKENGLSLLQGVRDYLLNPQFGNGGHFGLGCYFESKIGIFHNLAQLWTRISYDLLFEGDEIRLIMFKKTISPDALKVPLGDADAESKRLIQFTKEYLFPTSFKTTVKPGGIFNVVNSINVDIKKWRLALGHDFYAQQAEQITDIFNTNIDFSALRVEDAEAGNSQQHKVFAEATWFKDFNKSNLGIGLGGDTTIYSVGLGYDWTIYLKFAASF